MTLDAEVTTTTPVNCWQSFRAGALLDSDRPEIFISPDGHWYTRCGPKDTPDLTVNLKTPGLPPLKLKNIDHWRPQEEQTTCST